MLLLLTVCNLKNDNENSFWLRSTRYIDFLTSNIGNNFYWIMAFFRISFEVSYGLGWRMCNERMSLRISTYMQWAESCYNCKCRKKGLVMCFVEIPVSANRWTLQSREIFWNYVYEVHWSMFGLNLLWILPILVIGL